MALFVDGPASTIEDLVDQDAGLLETAVNSSINVSNKLRLAWEEIRSDLYLRLNSGRTSSEQLWRPLLRIEQVVVTPALKHWHAMQALSLFYRDAYFTLLLDRLQEKWRTYSTLARDARDLFVANGAALVANPLVQALPPVLGTVAAPQPGGLYYASLSWVGSGNQEGMPSVASSISVADGSAMTVSSQQPPVNATGFHVYAGTSLAGLTRQTVTPLPLTGTFEYIPGLTTTGSAPGTGQPPEFVRPLPRTIWRG